MSQTRPDVRIRPERDEDVSAIRDLTQAAFDGAPHSSGAEARIVDALREGRALTLSLVAVSDEEEVVGHIAFSPVQIEGGEGWYGLGPVSVVPRLQGHGIGSALIRMGLALLREMNAAGCILLGDPAYYGRFGFRSDLELSYLGYRTPNLQSLVLGGRQLAGAVVYHPAFDAA